MSEGLEPQLRVDGNSIGVRNADYHPNYAGTSRTILPISSRFGSTLTYRRATLLFATTLEVLIDLCAGRSFPNNSLRCTAATEPEEVGRERLPATNHSWFVNAG